MYPNRLLIGGWGVGHLETKVIKLSHGFKTSVQNLEEFLEYIYWKYFLFLKLKIYLLIRNITRKNATEINIYGLGFNLIDDRIQK